MAGNKITYVLDFKANLTDVEGQLNRLKSSLNAVIMTKPGKGILAADIERASTAAIKLQGHLQKALNPKTGRLDLSRMAFNMSAAGDSVQRLGTDLMRAGDAGKQAFLNTANAVVNAQGPIIKTNRYLTEMWTTLKNTARWQISSSILMGMVSAFRSMVSYTKELDKTLNDIRIVTGESKTQMAAFAKEANKAAKSLGVSTNEFAKANLIYRQQGDSAAEAMRKAEITTKAANVSFSASAQEMSDYLTALWNSYDVTSDKYEEYVDKMVRVGAVTATSTEEMATAMEKVAAAAYQTGVEYDQLLGVVSTVSSVTRQSAEQVGTAFKTIFARMTDLKLEGSIDEDGVTTSLGQVSGTLEAAGIKVKDMSGQLRDTGAILEDLGNKWESIDKNTQTAVAQAVAGKRQYTQLLALLGNWDMYKNTLKETANAQGELNKQQATYQQSVEAASARTKAKAEGLYATLLDEDTLISLIDGFGTFLEAITKCLDALGGIGPLLMYIAGIAVRKFAPKISEGIIGFGLNVAKVFGKSDAIISNYINKWVALMSKMSTSNKFSPVEQNQINTMSLLLQMQEQINNKSKDLTNEERQRLQIMYDQLKATTELEMAEAARADAQAKNRKNMATNAMANAMGEDVKSMSKRFSDPENAFFQAGSDAFTSGALTSESQKALKKYVGDAGLTVDRLGQIWDNLGHKVKHNLVDLISKELIVSEDVLRRYLESVKAAENAATNLTNVSASNVNRIAETMSNQGMGGSYVDPETKKPVKVTPKVKTKAERQIEQENEFKQLARTTVDDKDATAKEKKLAEELLAIYKQINHEKKLQKEKQKEMIKSAEQEKQNAETLNKLEKEKLGDMQKWNHKKGKMGGTYGSLFGGMNQNTSKKDAIKSLDLSKGSEIATALTSTKPSKGLTDTLQQLTGTKLEGKELLKVLQDLQKQFNQTPPTETPKKIKNVSNNLDDLGKKAKQTGRKLKKSLEANPEKTIKDIAALSGTFMSTGMSVSMLTSSIQSLSTAIEEGDWITVLTSGLMAASSAMTVFLPLLSLLKKGTDAAKVSQDAHNASVASNPYVAAAMAVIALVAVIATLVSAESAAEKAAKKHEAAMERLAKAEEKIGNYQSEIDSLEQLHDKLEAAAGDKKALAEMTNELNAATGEEYDLLSSGSKDYEKASAQLEYMIKQKKQLKQIEEERAKQAAAAAMANQTFDSDGEGWFTTSDKFYGTTAKSDLIKHWASLSDKEREELSLSGDAFEVSIDGNYENFKAGTVLQLIEAEKENMNKYFASYIEKNAATASLISSLIEEGTVNPKEIEKVLKAFTEDEELKEDISDAKGGDEEAQARAEKKLKELKNTYKDSDAIKQFVNDEIAGIQQVADAATSYAAQLERVNIGFGEQAKDLMDTGRTILKSFGEGIRPSLEDREAYIKVLKENQSIYGLTQEELVHVETALKDTSLTAKDFAKIQAQMIDKMVISSEAFTNLTEDNMGQMEFFLEEQGVENAKEMTKYYLNLKKAKEDIGKIKFDDSLNLKNIGSELKSLQEKYGLTENEVHKLVTAEKIFNNSKLNVTQKMQALGQYLKAIGNTTHPLAGLDGIYFSSDEKDYKELFKRMQVDNIDQLMVRMQEISDYEWRSEQRIQLSAASKTEQEEAKKDYNEKIKELDKEELNEIREYTKEREKLIKDLKKQEEEWFRTDALESYKESIEELLEITERMQDSLDKYDFSEKLGKIGDTPETAERVFKRVYAIGKENEKIAEEAKRQLDALLEQGMPEDAEAAQEWTNTINTLHKTWQEATIAMKENNLSAAMSAQIENEGARVAAEMEYVESQRSLMMDLIEINQKSAYFARQGREAILAKMMMNANGTKRKSEAVRKKEEENKELIKENNKYNEEISKANKESAKKDRANRKSERDDEWNEIHSEFIDNMDELELEHADALAEIKKQRDDALKDLNEALGKIDTSYTNMMNSLVSKNDDATKKFKEQWLKTIEDINNGISGLGTYSRSSTDTYNAKSPVDFKDISRIKENGDIEVASADTKIVLPQLEAGVEDYYVEKSQNGYGLVAYAMRNGEKDTSTRYYVKTGDAEEWGEGRVVQAGSQIGVAGEQKVTNIKKWTKDSNGKYINETKLAADSELYNFDGRTTPKGNQIIDKPTKLNSGDNSGDNTKGTLRPADGNDPVNLIAPENGVVWISKDSSGKETLRFIGETYSFSAYGTTGGVKFSDYLQNGQFIKKGTSMEKISGDEQLWFEGLAKGTKSAKGGKTLVGEEGREIVINPDGTAYIVGTDGAEIVDLQKGAQVIPNSETEKILNRQTQKTEMESFSKGTQPQTNGNEQNQGAARGYQEFVDTLVEMQDEGNQKRVKSLEESKEEEIEVLKESLEDNIEINDDIEEDFTKTYNDATSKAKNAIKSLSSDIEKTKPKVNAPDFKKFDDAVSNAQTKWDKLKESLNITTEDLEGIEWKKLEKRLNEFLDKEEIRNNEQYGGQGGGNTTTVPKYVANHLITDKEGKGGVAWLTSGYGMRIHPISGKEAMHNGQDWGVGKGNEGKFYANTLVDGIVLVAGHNTHGYGNQVIIQDANGYRYIFSHLHAIADDLKPGSRVTAGRSIGKVGTTGVSTSAHLHYEIVNPAGSFIDPNTHQYYSGSPGLPATTLGIVGELGAELGINEDGSIELLGVNGPEYGILPKGMRILSHEETVDFFSHPKDYRKSSGSTKKINAFANGTGVDYIKAMQHLYPNFVYEDGENALSKEEQAINYLKSDTVFSGFLEYVRGFDKNDERYENLLGTLVKVITDRGHTFKVDLGNYKDIAQEYARITKEGKMANDLPEVEALYSETADIQNVIKQAGEGHTDLNTPEKILNFFGLSFPEASAETKDALYKLYTNKDNMSDKEFSEKTLDLNRDMAFEIQEGYTTLWNQVWDMYNTLIEEGADQTILSTFESEILQPVSDKMLDSLKATEDALKASHEARMQEFQAYAKEITDRLTFENTKMQELNDAYKTRYDVLNELADVQHDIDNSLRDSMLNVKWMDKTTRETLFNEKDHLRVSEAISEIRADINAKTIEYSEKIANLSEDEWWQQTQLTEEYNKQVEAQKRKLAIVQAEIGLEQKRNALTQALQEKTVRVFTGGRWQQVADFNKVREATQAYEDQKYEIEKAQRTDQQAAISDKLELEMAKNNAEMEKLRKTEENLQESFDALFSATGDLRNKSIPELQGALQDVSSAIKINTFETAKTMGAKTEELATMAADEWNRTVTREGITPEIEEQAVANMVEIGIQKLAWENATTDEEKAAAKGRADASREWLKENGFEMAAMYSEEVGLSEYIKYLHRQGFNNVSPELAEKFQELGYNTIQSEAKYIAKQRQAWVTETPEGKEARHNAAEEARQNLVGMGRADLADLSRTLPLDEYINLLISDYGFSASDFEDSSLKANSLTKFFPRSFYPSYMKSTDTVGKNVHEISELIAADTMLEMQHGIKPLFIKMIDATKLYEEESKVGNLSEKTKTEYAQTINDVTHYSKDLGNILKEMPYESLSKIFNYVYSDDYIKLRNESGTDIDFTQLKGQHYESGLLQNLLNSENEEIKSSMLKLMSNAIPYKEINGIAMTENDNQQRINIENLNLPNVTDPNSFIEAITMLMKNQPK